MKKSKWLAILVSLLVVMSMLAACGSSSGNSNPTTSTAGNAVTESTVNAVAPETTAASPAPSKGKLVYWTVFTGPDAESMQGLVDGYNATNPDYTIDHKPMAAADFYQKLPVVVASGQDIPDLLIVHDFRMEQLSANKVISPITDAQLNSAGISSENFDKTLWQLSDFGGNHYGVPLALLCYTTYVNLDLQQKYGPHDLDDGVVTFDEVKATAQNAAKDGVAGIGFNPLSKAYAFMSYYGQLDGKLFDGNNNPVFDNDKAYKVLNLMKDFAKDGLTNKDGAASRDLFLAGKMVYSTDGTWALNAYKKSGVNFKEIDSVVFDPAKKGNFATSHQFAFAQNPNQTDDKIVGALKFVKYVGDNSIEWAKAGHVPASLSVTKSAEYQSMPQAFLSNESGSNVYIASKYYGFAESSLVKVVFDVLYGKITPEQAMAQATQEVKDAIAAQ